MALLSCINFFCMLAYTYLAIVILFNNPASLLNRLTTIIFLCCILWCLGKLVVHNPLVDQTTAFKFMKIAVLGAWSFSAFLLWFALVLTEKKRILRKIWIYPALFAVPAVTIAIQWFNGSLLTYVRRPFGWGLEWRPSILTILLFVYIFSFITLSCIIIYHFSITSSSRMKKRQARIISISIVCGFIIGYGTNIIIPKFTSIPVPDLAHNMALLWLAGMVYAILKYNFLSVTPATAARNIISTMADALILADQEGRIVSANRSAAALLGYGNDRLQELNIESLIADSGRKKGVLDDIRATPVVNNRDAFLRTRDGREIPVNLSSSLLKGKDNTTAGIVIIARDITPQKLAEQKLIREKKRAEEANAAKSEFLANMSHELRTPLNHIIGFTELLLDEDFGELNEIQNEYLHDVHKSGEHLLALINGMLDLSKVESGKYEMRFSDVDVRLLVSNSIDFFKRKFMNRSVTFELDMDGIPETISADYRKLRQILYNLLSNAVKFTAGDGTVTLTVRMCDLHPERRPLGGGPGSGIRFSVSDTGIGLDSGHLTRIFEPFERVEGSVSRKYQGTGLGLALTKSLVELHGGSIRAESEGVGRGSVFSFILPVAHGKDPLPAPREGAG